MAFSGYCPGENGKYTCNMDVEYIMMSRYRSPSPEPYIGGDDVNMIELNAIFQQLHNESIHEQNITKTGNYNLFTILKLFILVFAMIATISFIWFIIH